MEMIRSALDREADAADLGTPLDAIAFHCNVPSADIRILDVDDGCDMDVLRHFVAIDHATQSVVLALRGTLSISGALVDMKGMDRTCSRLLDRFTNLSEKSRQFVVSFPMFTFCNSLFIIFDW